MTIDAGAAVRPARRFYIDVARIAAIMAVIAIHNWSLLQVLAVGTNRWWAVDVALNASRWAVPVFVLISGGLLLGPKPGEGPSTFYRRRLARVAVPAIFWITAYLVFRATYLGQEMTAHTVVTDLVMATPFTHLYFLYLIVGLYLVTPLVRPFTATASRTELSLAAGALLAVWAANTLLPYTLGVDVGINGLIFWVPYLGFYLAGRALYGLQLSRRASVLMALGVAVLVAAQIVSVFLLARTGDGSWQGYPQSYFSIFTIGSALLIYALCAQDTPGQWRSDRLGRLVAVLGAATFGVFLVHEMLLYWHSRDVRQRHATGAGDAANPDVRLRACREFRHRADRETDPRTARDLLKPQTTARD